MNRVILGLAGLLLIVMALYVAYELYSLFGRPSRLPGRPRDTVAYSYEEEFQESDPAQQPTAPISVVPYRVSIQGRVVGGDLRPRSDVTLDLGGEAIVLGSDGRFALGEIERARTATLTCMKGDEEIARWENVVVGAAPEPAVSSGSSSGAVGEVAPPRPERIYLTVNLFRQDAGESGRDASAVDATFIRVDQVLVEDWGTTARIRCQGSANLPDEALIAASLYFDGVRGIPAFDPGVVSEGEFVVDLWSAGVRKLFSGVYTLNLSFNQMRMTPEWIGRWSAAIAQLTDGTMVVEIPVAIGASDQARAEDLASQGYYREVLGAAEGFKGDLTSRVKEIHQLAKNWKPELLQQRAETRIGWFHDDLVQPDGRLAEARWRQFIDVEWRPKVKEFLDRHQARGPQKYQEAEGRMLDLYLALYQESYTYSLFSVYPAFNLSGHPNDIYPDEAELGDLQFLERRVHDNIRNLRRYCHLVADEPVTPEREE